MNLIIDLRFVRIETFEIQNCHKFKCWDRKCEILKFRIQKLSSYAFRKQKAKLS